MTPDRFAAMEQRQVSVPEGWRSVRLGDLFEQIVDTGHSDDLPVLSVTLDRGVIPRASLERRLEREVARPQYLRARPGDIAYNTMRMWQGGSGLVRQEGYLSPAYTVCRAQPGEDPEFWAFAFKSDAMIRAFRSHSQGFAKDRYRLYFQHFATVPALRPPLPEQRKIAAILASVDDMIEKTEVVIHHMEDVKEMKMRELLPDNKDSHQDYARLESVTVSQSGGTPDRTDPHNFGGGIPWVKSGEVDCRHITTTEETLSHRGLSESAAKLCPVGSILVAMYGATAGKVGRLAVEAATNQAVLALIPRAGKVTVEFLYYRLIASSNTLLGRTQGSGQPNLNAGLIRSLEIPLPTIEEQNVIGLLLSSFDDSIESEGAVLSLLRQLKSILANAFLTGQLRVRPDEALS